MSTAQFQTAQAPAWPPPFGTEFKRRVTMQRNLNMKKSLRAGLKAKYKTDPVQWINDWCITYNPRNTAPIPKTLPFLLFPRQVDFVHFLQDCLAKKESGLTEKCRDVGATWLSCAFSVWLWLYVPGASIGWGSRKTELVDRLGDPDSIFQKMRMIIRALPAWMLPKGFSMRDHCFYMKILNPENGATIKGEAGDNIGRGGRSLIYFKDESAHYEHPELIEASLGDNTDVQIDISSVNGTGNIFYRRRKAGVVWQENKKDEIPRGKTRVFIFDWRHHPGKNQEWYDLRKAKMESEGLGHVFAQEVDRDYVASIQGIIIPPKWVKAAIDAHKIKRLGIKPEGERTSALDVADGGLDKNAQAIRYGVILQFCEAWGQSPDVGISAQRAVKSAQLHGVKELYYDSIGVGSGVKVETNRMKEGNILPRGIIVVPWNAAASPLNPDEYLIPNDDKSPKNGDFFLNMKAQAWWMLRIRFEKTYKAVMQRAQYDPSELISIPSDLEGLEDLVTELSQAVHKNQHGSGKTVVDKQPDGTPSPNKADSVVMAYWPTRELSILDVL